MRARSIVLAAAAALLLLGGGLWIASPSGRPAEGTSAVPTAAGHASAAPAASAGADAASRAPLPEDEAGRGAPADETVLRGRVVTASGAPVADALVELLENDARYSIVRGIAQAEGRVGKSTRTDARGEFRIECDPSRPQDLAASATGFAKAFESSRYAGENVEIRLTFAAAIEVRVREERTEEPVASAQVRLFRADGSPLDRGLTRRDEVTGPDGVARFDSLSAGRFELWVTPARHVSATARVAAAEGERAVHDVAVRPGAAIRGRVTDRRTGKPIEGAEVADTWTYEHRARTDSAGDYRLEGVEPNRQAFVYVRKSGYASADTAIDLVRESGASIDFSLEPGFAVRGRILDPDGRPRADALATAAAEILMSSTSEFRSVRSDAQGRFEIPDLRRDVATVLVVVAPLAAPLTRPIPEPEGFRTAVDLGDLPLVAGASLAGTLVDSGRSPLADVSIVATWNRGAADPSEGSPGRPGTFLTRPITVRTDARGRFRLDGLGAGELSLLADVPGLAFAKREHATIVLAEGERRTGFEWRLDLGLSIRGSVLGPDGKGLARILVDTGYGEPGDETAAVRTREDGSFELKGLTPGKRTLHASSDLFSLDTGEMSPFVEREGVEAGDQAVVIRLPAAAWVEGRAEHADGSPVEGCEVLWVDGTSRFVRHAPHRTDRDGKFRIAVPPDVELSLLATAPAPSGDSAASRPHARLDRVRGGESGLIVRLPGHGVIPRPGRR